MSIPLIVRWTIASWISLAATTAAAEVIRQPANLEMGEKYRLVFVTSTVRDATSSNMADYDAFVQSVADAAPEVGQWEFNWRAIGSTAEIDARDHTETNWMEDEGVPIYRLDGSLFYRNYEMFWNGDENIDLRAFRINELGNLASFESLAFTGTSVGGTAVDPGGNSSPLGDVSVSAGLANASAHLWIADTTRAAISEHHFYAISDAVVAVPEPTSVWCLLIGSIYLACRRRRRTR